MLAVSTKRGGRRIEDDHFGVSDGLVSNLSLVAGVAGASVDRTDVLVVGLAGLVAGALSMAVGEYVSVRANQELLQHELDIERSESDQMLFDDEEVETRGVIPQGPVFTIDDVIEFHYLLEDDRYIEEFLASSGGAS